MTGNSSLSGIQLAAALAEEIYRRSEEDDPINVIGDLGCSTKTIVTPNGINQDEETASEYGKFYYYSERGFVGRVVEKDGIFYVVFRGTDSAESFSSGLAKAATSGLSPTALDPERKSDIGDWVTNFNLANGRHAPSQLDDALAFTQEVIRQLANGDKSKVAVVGQSLGGGLAGLVSAIEDVRGYSIAPAPFQKQIRSRAELAAFKEIFSNVDLGALFQGFAPDYGTMAAFLEAVTEAEREQYYTKTNEYEIRYNQSLNNNLEIHTIKGEILSDGVAQLGFGQQFNKERIEYDVGESAGLTAGAGASARGTGDA